MLRRRILQRFVAAGLGLALAAFAGPLLAKPAGKKAPPTAASPVLAKPDGTQAPPAAASPDGAAPTANGAPPAQAAAEVSTPEPASAAASIAPEQAQTKLSAEQLAALREETSQLVDEMSQARAKAALLGKTLFKTQLRLRVQNLAAPDPRLLKIEIKLDGAPVFVGDGTTLSGDDARQVFQGFIAPGRHVLTAQLKQQSREDATFGYNLHDSYYFKVQRGKLSELTLIVDDDSDMASDYPDDGNGEYDVRLKLRVRTKNLGEE
jgi:hypothetical protein